MNAEDFLGVQGAMLSGFKTNPPGLEDHMIFWNACVFKKISRNDAVSIWYGDLDVTAREENLQKLADALGSTIVVTREHPWRWDGFKKSMADHKKFVKTFGEMNLRTEFVEFKPNKRKNG